MVGRYGSIFNIDFPLLIQKYQPIKCNENWMNHYFKAHSIVKYSIKVLSHEAKGITQVKYPTQPSGLVRLSAELLAPGILTIGLILSFSLMIF